MFASSARLKLDQNLQPALNLHLDSSVKHFSPQTSKDFYIILNVSVKVSCDAEHLKPHVDIKTNIQRFFRFYNSEPEK